MYNIKRKPLPNIRMRAKHLVIHLPSGRKKTSHMRRRTIADDLHGMPEHLKSQQ